MIPGIIDLNTARCSICRALTGRAFSWCSLCQNLYCSRLHYDIDHPSDCPGMIAAFKGEIEK